MKIKAMEEIFLRGAWVFLFCLASFALYEYAGRSLKRESDLLEAKRKSLHEEIELAVAKQKILKLKVESQSDPGWIELTLMKELGLAPEGERKILFEKEAG